jgi:hypothetical protein
MSRPVWPRALLALMILGYAAFLVRYIGAYAGGSDSSGYLNSAKILATGRVTIPMRLVAGLAPDILPSYTHVPLGFVPNGDHVTPTYPMGLPLLIMSVAQVTGWGPAPNLVMGLHALAGLWLVYLLGRKAGLEADWALLGSLLLAASPVYIFMSLQAMSDVPALVWATTAVYLAWCSRQRTWLALPAGTALGIAVLVRPTDLLAFVPVAVALGFSLRRSLLLVLGGLPAAIVLGALNLAAYGRILATGYIGIASEFSLKVVPASLLHYATWLPMMLTPIIVLALGLPALRRRRSLPAVLLGLWALVFLFFYVFNIHTHEFWWYLRFLLPAFPAMIVAALLVAGALVEQCPLPFRRWGPAIISVVALVNGIAWSRHFYAHEIGHGEKVYPLTAVWLESHLPANAVVACMQTSGAVLYYTHYPLVRWDMITPADFLRIARDCTAAGQPLYAVLFPYEIEDKNWAAFDKHLTGRWVQIGAVRQVSIWRYDPFPDPR